jgi:hypothetical protein
MNIEILFNFLTNNDFNFLNLYFLNEEWQIPNDSIHDGFAIVLKKIPKRKKAS